MLENIKSGEKRFETCKYNLMGSKCSLDGYPVLDCEKCTTYKELPTKRYCLVLCQDEPDESIVFAELTDMYADAVRKDIKGMLNKPTTLMTVDGKEVDVGIVDDIFESQNLILSLMMTTITAKYLKFRPLGYLKRLVLWTHITNEKA